MPALLEQLVQIRGDFKIRIGMGNPDHLSKIETRLLEVYRHPKIFKFLHLPLQAGHDKTLKAMRRLYTVQEFISTVERFKKRYPRSIL